MTGLVLYIEDTPDNMTLVRRVVESLGCKLEGAVTGQDGLRKATELHPDIVLLDINLPDISGYQVAQNMRASGDPHLTYVPIIALTANAMRGDAEKVLEAGCDVYMSKPINIRELIARISSLMEIVHGAGCIKKESMALFSDDDL